ncbi:MAG: STN domain-containing protein [Odoribacter splanchnicus]
MENADLKSCIQQIERLTGIGFLYNGRELEQIKGITLDLQNVEINTILSRLLEGPGYTYEIVNGVVAIKRAVTVNNVDLPQAKADGARRGEDGWYAVTGRFGPCQRHFLRDGDQR